MYTFKIEEKIISPMFLYMRHLTFLLSYQYQNTYDLPDVQTI